MDNLIIMLMIDYIYYDASNWTTFVCRFGLDLSNPDFVEYAKRYDVLRAYDFVILFLYNSVLVCAVMEHKVIV